MGVIVYIDAMFVIIVKDLSGYDSSMYSYVYFMWSYTICLPSTLWIDKNVYFNS